MRRNSFQVKHFYWAHESSWWMGIPDKGRPGDIHEYQAFFNVSTMLLERQKFHYVVIGVGMREKPTLGRVAHSYSLLTSTCKTA